MSGPDGRKPVRPGFVQSRMPRIERVFVLYLVATARAANPARGHLERLTAIGTFRDALLVNRKLGIEDPLLKEFESPRLPGKSPPLKSLSPCGMTFDGERDAVALHCVVMSSSFNLRLGKPSWLEAIILGDETRESIQPSRHGSAGTIKAHTLAYSLDDYLPKLQGVVVKTVRLSVDSTGTIFFAVSVIAFLTHAGRSARIIARQVVFDPVAAGKTASPCHEPKT